MDSEISTAQWQGHHRLRAKLQGMELRPSARRTQSRGKPEKTEAPPFNTCSLTGTPKPVSRAKFKANASFPDLIFLLNYLVVAPQFYLV